jgi:hypothetical protein
MANKVFANGREVSCKAANGKSICAFPDVCFTPPTTPATPPGVPIPYPNTAFAKDTAKGSKKVKISGKEVMLKNKSHFKKSTGDEAGSAPKKGLITSTNRGKVYFTSWSMDVKFEGQNVDRHLDLTTHNHMSMPGNTPPWPFLDAMAFDQSSDSKCKDVARAVKENCADKIKKKKGKVNRQESLNAMCAHAPCKHALRCVLTKKEPSNCCPQPQPRPPKQTPHHIVPASQFKKIDSQGGGPLLVDSAGRDRYNYNRAPCICAEGTGHSTGEHGDIHAETNTLTVTHRQVEAHVKGRSVSPDARWQVSDAEAVGAKAVHEVTRCNEDCIKEQVRQGHAEMGIQPTDTIRPTTAGKVRKSTNTGSGL